MSNSLRIVSCLTPVRTTFIISLLLSLIAWLGSTINRDGMLYVKAAQACLDGGPAAAREIFNWPFLPIVMALAAKLTGLSPEHAGYLLNALFMAGTCTLMVAGVQRRQTEIAWAACLTVLALPGLNEYRNELLREYGCWFFVMLAFWLALRWSEQPRWLSALGVQAALGIAALFRPEALALFPALIAWQCFDSPHGQRWQRLIMLGALPLAVGAILVALFLSGNVANRLAREFRHINTARFDAKVQVLAGALIVYARGQAQAILFFGSLALIPLKLFQKFGIFLLPLAVFFINTAIRTHARHHSLFLWAIAAHVLVLSVFVLDLQFLAGRYVGLTLLFSTPFIATGLLALIRHSPHWRIVTIGLAVALMASNVVSTSQGKTHLVDAGRWLSNNTADTTKVYIDSGRTAYHAGWLKVTVEKRNDRPGIGRAVATGKYEVFVLEVSRNDPPVDDWLTQTGLRVIHRFEHPNRDTVIIAVLAEKQP